MANKWLEINLFCTTLLSGFYGGMGFFSIIGGMPALKNMSDISFAEYWQNIDRYMAARMPVFAPLLMLLILVSALLLFINKQFGPGLLVITSLLVMIADLVFTLRINHPLNQLIQSWDLNHLPPNVGEIKLRVIEAFRFRTLFMLSTFAFVLLALWWRRK